MDTKEYGKVIAKNLKRIAYEHQKTQADIARELNLTQSTVSSWMLGTRIPRMDKIDMLCNYFNCSRVEIMEENPTIHRELVSDEERDLLRLFRALSVEGRAEALERIAEMSESKRWSRKKEELKSSVS